MRKAILLSLLFLLGISLFSCCSMNIDWNMSEEWKRNASQNYSQAVMIEGIDVIKQDVSCGYAVIEMFSQWENGTKASVTEESLYNKYGKVVTSTGKNFAKEMNKQFPKYKTTFYKNLSSDIFIDKAYNSLKDGIPVPFEWAAKLDNEWTLHYSLLVGMDIPNDKITVLNPYGYKEELSINDFLYRTTFEAFENMPFGFSMGFAFGVFEKNALFICSKK